MINPISRVLSGRRWRDHVLPVEICGSSQIKSSLLTIERRWPSTVQSLEEDDEAPIFLLSAGWGSGSTLLQRLVVSSGSCMIWGEPFDHAGPVHRLSQILYPIKDTWPKSKYFLDSSKTDNLAQRWIANLTPEFAHLRDAHRSFFLSWLKEPAVKLGFERWGMKEVRITIDHARYLRWLFPRAKFLFIYRDVIDSYRSCIGVNWYSIWPDYRVRRVSLFAHHWRLLLEGFLSDASGLDATLIRYEDLVAGRFDHSTISQYLQVGKFDSAVLGARIGSRSHKHAGLSPFDRFIINSIAGELRKRLGYR